MVPKEPLPPRDDIVDFNPQKHQAELDKNLKLDNVPDQFKELAISTVKKHWDVFCSEGYHKHIRGFIFQVDTGDVELICCK